jgi:hypothetical protein
MPLPETWILYLLSETSVEEVLNQKPYSIMFNGRESGRCFVMMHFTYGTSERPRNIGSDAHLTKVSMEVHKHRRCNYNIM